MYQLWTGAKDVDGIDTYRWSGRNILPESHKKVLKTKLNHLHVFTDVFCFTKVLEVWFPLMPLSGTLVNRDITAETASTCTLAQTVTCMSLAVTTNTTIFVKSHCN